MKRKYSSDPIFNPRNSKPIRKTLRKNPTLPEKVFWSWIRSKQLGVKFRRQHAIGRYIVDFYCSELNLIIEIDGDSHFTNDGLRYDQKRSQYLNRLGLYVTRFTNEQVMQEKEGVLLTLNELIGSLSQRP